MLPGIAAGALSSSDSPEEVTIPFGQWHTGNIVDLLSPRGPKSRGAGLGVPGFRKCRGLMYKGAMLPDYIQFLSFFLISVALLKIAASFLAHNFPGSALADGLAWFVS